MSGDLELDGVHPGDPYDADAMMLDQLRFERPTPAEASRIVRGLGWSHLAAASAAAGAPAVAGAVPSRACATRGPVTREAIHHHYDVSNAFYEWCSARR